MTPSVVLSRLSPCNVTQGYASVAELPAASPGCHFEHPAVDLSPCLRRAATPKLSRDQSNLPSPVMAFVLG